MVVQDIRKIAGGERLGQTAQKEYISFRDIWSFLRRHMLIIVLATMTGIVLGALFISRTEPTYLAIARLVIDPQQARIASQDANTGTIIIEAAEIASQVEIVKSEAIARAVIRELNLTEDPEIRESHSWKSVVRGWFVAISDFFMSPEKESTNNTPDEEDIMRRTMAGFLGRVLVRRVDQSYVIEIGYTSTSPVKAAKTANAIAKAYIKAGMDARSEIAVTGASWLEDRLLVIGSQAREASVDAEEFKKKHGITDLGATNSLDQQQITEVSTQLLTAQANTAAEAARLATIKGVLSGNIPDGYMDAALSSPPMLKLREDRRAAATRMTALVSRYGKDSTAVKAVEAEIAAIDEDIHEELLRIKGVSETNLDTARKRQELIASQLKKLTETGAERNLARAQLDELESRASTYRRMYESMLQQLITTLQRQSFPVGDARMVAAATPPLVKAWPKTSLILLFATVLGGAVGVMLAGLREMLDRRVGSGERLGSEFGLPLLGHVPVTRFRPITPLVEGHKAKRLDEAKAPLRHVLDEPYSRFSESLRNVKNSIDSALSMNESIIVGVTSVDSREGKTTVAANLAQLYLNEGVAILLVDANFQYPRVSELVRTHGVELGMQVVPAAPPPLTGKRQRNAQRYATRKMRAQGANVQVLDRPLIELNESGFTSVPVLTVEQIKRASNPNHRFGHLPALKSELDRMRERFPVIIVDLAAFGDSVDTRVASAYVDGIVVVLDNHRKMTVERFAEALATYGKARVGIVGVVLNRSGIRRFRGRAGGALRGARL